ncbi:hypothetical protein [Luedemannella flava]|uniref:hypothetical protein n=1 Tax=Luedemannella flava TaxID=349316 RepID=UPI0031E218A7
MITTPPPRIPLALRIVLFVLAMGLSIAVAVWVQNLVDEVDWLRAAHRLLRDDGLAIVTMSLSGIVIGAVLHSPGAGGTLRRGWLATFGMLAYGLVIVGLAALIRPLAFPYSPGGGRGDAGALYPAWLTCVLLSFALVAWGGGPFSAEVHHRRTARGAKAAPSPSWLGRAWSAVPAPVAMAGLLGWLIGGSCLLLLLIGRAARAVF